MTNEVRANHKAGRSPYVWVTASGCTATLFGAITFSALRFPSRATSALLQFSILLSFILTLSCLWLGCVYLWTKLTAGRPLPHERVSQDLVAAILVLPLVTAVTTSATTFASIGAGLWAEADPSASLDPSVLALEIAVASVLVASGAPFVALYNVAEERQGRRAPLFDPAVPDEQFMSALADRWNQLRSRRRLWMKTWRSTALGTETRPPEAAWPSRPTSRGAHRLIRLVPRVAIAILLMSVATIVTSLALDDFADNWSPTLGAAIYAAIPTALSVLTTWLYAYQRLGREQGEADLLRLAAEMRPIAKVETPQQRLRLSERLRLALRALRGR